MVVESLFGRATQGLFIALIAIACSACSTVTTSVDKASLQARTASTVVSFTVPDGGSSGILACPSRRLEYTPIPALPAGGYTQISIGTNGKPVVTAKNWPTTASGVNALLTNTSTNTAMSEWGASGSVASIFSASHSRKQMIIDFMKYRIEPLTDSNAANLGWVRVGAGLRVVIEITKDDGSISGSLVALAASAKAGKIEGSISVELIGMDAKETTQAMPFTVDLSDGNIQKVIEALAIVKTKLYDSSTTVYPNLIARVECAETVVTK